MPIKALIPYVFVAVFTLAMGCNRANEPQMRPSTGGPRSGNTSSSGAQPALKDAEAYAARAFHWLNKEEYDKALEDYDNAIRLDPTNAEYFNSRALTWRTKGTESVDSKERPACEDKTLSDYDEAIRLDSKYAAAINNRAWLLATSKIDRCRNGSRAVQETTKACELSGWKNGAHLDTLSAAYAEVGDFEKAIHWQKKALEDPDYAREDREEAKAKLALYVRKQPYRY